MSHLTPTEMMSVLNAVEHLQSQVRQHRGISAEAFQFAIESNLHIGPLEDLKEFMEVQDIDDASFIQAFGDIDLTSLEVVQETIFPVVYASIVEGVDVSIEGIGAGFKSLLISLGETVVKQWRKLGGFKKEAYSAADKVVDVTKARASILKNRRPEDLIPDGFEKDLLKDGRRVREHLWDALDDEYFMIDTPKMMVDMIRKHGSKANTSTFAKDNGKTVFNVDKSQWDLNFHRALRTELFKNFSKEKMFNLQKVHTHLHSKGVIGSKLDDTKNRMLLNDVAKADEEFKYLVVGGAVAGSVGSVYITAMQVLRNSLDRKKKGYLDPKNMDICFKAFIDIMKAVDGISKIKASNKEDLVDNLSKSLGKLQSAGIVYVDGKLSTSSDFIQKVKQSSPPSEIGWNGKLIEKWVQDVNKAISTYDESYLKKVVQTVESNSVDESVAKTQAKILKSLIGHAGLLMGICDHTLKILGVSKEK